MMKIVLGGSRKLAFIPEVVMERLEVFMNLGAEFLVGDAPGIDTKFQQYLSRNGYRKVTVLTSAGFVRNNVGNWTTIHIDSGLKGKGHARHSAKDREMTLNATAGVMIWDKESAGTLANVIDLVRSGKTCLLYIAGDNQLVQLDNSAEMEAIVCNFADVKFQAEQRLNAYERRKRKNVGVNNLNSLFD